VTQSTLSDFDQQVKELQAMMEREAQTDPTAGAPASSMSRPRAVPRSSASYDSELDISASSALDVIRSIEDVRSVDDR
jgi:hypothetical protein